MNKQPTIAFALAITLVALLGACRPSAVGTPTVVITPEQIQSRLALRVSGQDWPAGAQITLALSAPNAQVGERQFVTSALADASGGFVAILLVPDDPQLTSLAEMWVIAQTRDLAKTAVGVFRNPQPSHPSPTPLSRPTVMSTPTSMPLTYALGYVQSISLADRIIALRPVQGQINTVNLLSDAQISFEGQPVQLSEVQVGDLIEASGADSSATSIAAAYLRILAHPSIQPAVTPTVTPTPTMAAIVWQGQYYNNTTLSGNPALTRSDPVVDFNWQGDSPSASLPVEGFAVRWTGTWPFDSGTYRFFAQVDDGVRLWLDNHLIIDRWYESAGALYTSDAFLGAGAHAVRVEYFEGRGNALAKVWWEYRSPDAPTNYSDWRGEYYSNSQLSGLPVLVVNERTLDFNWFSGPGAAGLPHDGFSARWTRVASLEPGLYRFFARVDDGVRLWVDEVLCIDQWQDTAVQLYSCESYLGRGSHSIRVEYYENTGEALIRVWWELAPATPTATPTDTRVMPTATPGLTPTWAELPASPTPTATETATSIP